MKEKLKLSFDHSVRSEIVLQNLKAIKFFLFEIGIEFVSEVSFIFFKSNFSLIFSFLQIYFLLFHDQFFLSSFFCIELIRREKKVEIQNRGSKGIFFHPSKKS